jgi:predicted dehydrogenase
MALRDIGIIVNGATGRIGATQHLANALAPIRAEGGLPVGNDRILPRLLLVGRDRERLAGIAESYGIGDWTADLDAALARPDFTVFFDAAATHQRVAALKKAIAAGKHIYSEKPVAPSVAEGRALLEAAQARGLKAGAVEDKLNLPGLQKMLRLAQSGFFGHVTGFKLDFGWWVFDGAERPSQRPSWNYRKSGGGGLTHDMVPHWRYVIEGILGRIARVVSATKTALPERVDEEGRRYAVDVDDTSVTLAELASGAISSRCRSTVPAARRSPACTAAGCRAPPPHPRFAVSIRTPTSARIIAHRGLRLPARSPTPIRIASAGRISCAMSLPAHRWSAILPPVCAMCSWRKRAIAAPRNRHG